MHAMIGLSAALYGALDVRNTGNTSLVQARRDLGAVFTGGAFVFGGGCTDTQNVYSCTSPSDSLDVFSSNATRIPTLARLGEARGWPSACSSGGVAVFVGGGTVQKMPHSRTSDKVVVSPATLQPHVTTTPDALSQGRWGTSCTSTEAKIYVAGGKVVGSKQSTSAAIDEYDIASDTWSLSADQLSQGRESMGATTVAGSALFAGGWAWINGVPQSSAVLDVFAPGGSSPTTLTLPDAAFWMGAVALGDAALIVGDSNLTVWRGGALSSSPLPSELVGKAKPAPSPDTGGGVPGAHVMGNGVVVSTAAGGVGCFYSWRPSALYCYSPATDSWNSAPASAMHKGGAIVAAEGTVLVGGGYDDTSPSQAPTDVVDIFQVSVS